MTGGRSGKMIKIVGISGCLAISIAVGGAFAAGEEAHVEDFSFSFEGPFGTV